jgi:hypothetical protein
MKLDFRLIFKMLGHVNAAESQLRVAEVGSWGPGHFAKPGEEERPQLETATKQRIEDRDWEH